MAKRARYSAAQVRDILQQSDSSFLDTSESDSSSSGSETETCDVGASDNESEWRPAQMEPAQIPGFLGRNRVADNGIAVATAGFEPLNYFRLFVGDQLVSEMVTETNRYAHQLLHNPRLKPHSRMHVWTDVSEEEMKRFLGLLLLMGFAWGRRGQYLLS
jgi:hypothetical protein